MLKSNFIYLALLLILLYSCASASSEHLSNADQQNILHSSNIAEIEKFLENSHPDDPRRFVLKPKLAALKNAQWRRNTGNTINENKTSEKNLKNENSSIKKAIEKSTLSTFAVSTKNSIKNDDGKIKENTQTQVTEEEVKKSVELTRVKKIEQNSLSMDPPKNVSLKKESPTPFKNDFSQNKIAAHSKKAVTIAQSTKIVLNTKISNSEEGEFKELITKGKNNQQDKTLKILNTLFDQDISSKDAILLVQNKFNCNMILRILGNKSYNLAVPSNSENSIVIEKGLYKVTSSLCGRNYIASKDVQKNMIILLKEK